MSTTTVVPTRSQQVSEWMDYIRLGEIIKPDVGDEGRKIFEYIDKFENEAFSMLSGRLRAMKSTALTRIRKAFQWIREGTELCAKEEDMETAMEKAMGTQETQEEYLSRRDIEITFKDILENDQNDAIIIESIKYKLKKISEFIGRIDKGEIILWKDQIKTYKHLKQGMRDLIRLLNENRPKKLVDQDFFLEEFILLHLETSTNLAMLYVHTDIIPWLDTQNTSMLIEEPNEPSTKRCWENLLRETDEFFKRNPNRSKYEYKKNCNNCCTNKQLIFALKDFNWRMTTKIEQNRERDVFRIEHIEDRKIIVGQRVKNMKIVTVINLEKEQLLLKQKRKVNKLTTGMYLLQTRTEGDKIVFSTENKVWYESKIIKKKFGVRDQVVFNDLEQEITKKFFFLKSTTNPLETEIGHRVESSDFKRKKFASNEAQGEIWGKFKIKLNDLGIEERHIVSIWPRYSLKRVYNTKYDKKPNTEAQAFMNNKRREAIGRSTPRGGIGVIT